MAEDDQYRLYRTVQRHGGNIEPGGWGDIQYEIFDPSTPGAMLKVHLKRGQQLKAISGCMVAASRGVEIEGKARFTLRALLRVEARSAQVMTAVKEHGWVMIAPNYMGSIMAVPLHGQELCIGDGAFLAAIGDVAITSVIQPLPQAMLSRSSAGFFTKSVKGSGIVFVCAIGSMTRFDVDKGRKIIVRNGHLVLWPRDMENKMRMTNNNIMSTYLAGQGVVSELTGPGFVYIQTRNPTAFSSWVAAHSPEMGGDGDDGGGDDDGGDGGE